MAKEKGENDEIGDNLDELCGEEEATDSNSIMYIGNKDTGQENNSLAL